MTPFCAACLRGCTEVVKLLIDHPNVDINHRSEFLFDDVCNIVY